MQFGHDNFCCAAAKLIVFVNVGGNASAIVRNRNRVVWVNRDDDVIAVSRKGFVNGIVQDFKDHVMQACAIARVTDVHAGPLTHRFETFEHFNRIGTVFGGLHNCLICHFNPLQKRFSAFWFTCSDGLNLVVQGSVQKKHKTFSCEHQIFNFKSDHWVEWL